MIQKEYCPNKKVLKSIRTVVNNQKVLVSLTIDGTNTSQDEASNGILNHSNNSIL
jgi:hypothetical protein